MQIFLPANLAPPPREPSSSKAFLLGIPETCLEKGGVVHRAEGSFFTMNISRGNNFEQRMFLSNSFML